MPRVVPDLVAPAHLWVPDTAVDTLGPYAVELMGLCGRVLDPEQAAAIDAIMSIRDNGKWAALEAAVIEPRQNGKSGGILLPVVLTDAVLLEAKLIVWSAHRYVTAQEAFRDLVGIIDNVDDIRRRVRKVSNGNGEEGVEFLNGARINFLARQSGASGRGLSGDRVVLDEALYLTPAIMGGLMPTMSARDNPQIMYGSSAGFAFSEVLLDVRDRGREGGDPDLVYVEHCAPEGGCADKDCDHNRKAVGCALDDRANWRKANTAHPRRITERVIAAERRSLKPLEFARERLGWWESRKRGGLFHMPAWWKLTDVDSTPGDRIVFGVHVSPDRTHAAVAVGSVRGDGTVHVELIAHDGLNTKGEQVGARAEGIGWVVPYVTDRHERHGAAGVVLAGAMAAGALAVDLEQLAGFDSLNTGEVRKACAALFDLVVEGKGLAHRGEVALGEAVMAARRSSDRDGWVFDADPDVDLSPLYAVALAAYGARTEEAVDVSVHAGEWECDEDGCPCPIQLEPGARCDTADGCGHVHQETDEHDDDDAVPYGVVTRPRY